MSAPPAERTRTQSDWLLAQAHRLGIHLRKLAPDAHFLGVAGAEETDLTELYGEGLALLEELARDGVDWPLARLHRECGLVGFDLDLLFFALLPDLDDRFGELFHNLRGGSDNRWPSLGMALRSLFPVEADRWFARAEATRTPLWELGALRTRDPVLPALDQPLVPSRCLSSAIDGQLPSTLDSGFHTFDVSDDPHALEALAFRDPIVDLAGETAQSIVQANVRFFHLDGGDQAPSRLVCTALAKMLEHRLVRIVGVDSRVEEVLRDAALLGVLHRAVVCVEVGPEVKHVRIPASVNRATAVLLYTAEGCELEVPPTVRLLRIRAPRPRPVEQAAVWSELLRRVGGTAAVDVVANQTRLTVGDIIRCVEVASTNAAVSGRPGPNDEDVRAAMRQIVPEPSCRLAHVTRPAVRWSELVLDRRPKGQLEDLVRRVQHRVTVQGRWASGLGSGRGEGLVTLLHGESGVGKTLAAEAIASQLGLPLMSVDLSRVVSKYIGETEKHLSSLFDAAEGFRGLLFFDEADAIFGKRTGVKDSHDRYANIETNYLLHRLEQFEGIAVLTTNLLQNLDEGFTRRIQFIVRFPRPNAGQQRRIWKDHLPAGQLHPSVDLADLTRAYDLVGGEIRNAALTAAFAAAASELRCITAELLIDAARQELIKKGRPAPKPT